MMAVVACAAVAFGTYAAFARGTGDPLLGFVIVAGCTAGVAWLRATEVIKKHRSDRKPVTARRRLVAILTSCGVAALIVGLADLAFILAYGFFAGGPQFFLFSDDPRSQVFLPEGLVAGSVAGLAVGYLSRRAFWRPVGVPGRFFRSLAPFSILFLLFEANVMWERSSYRHTQAANHDVLAVIYGGESSLPAPPHSADFRPRPEMVAYHVRMKHKWEYAAMRPWLSVATDPPPPEP